MLVKGFKVPEFDEEGKRVLDPEVEEDPADFDRKNEEVSTLKNLLYDIKDVFMIGNFFEITED